MARVLVALIAVVVVVLHASLAQAGDQRPIVAFFGIEAKRVILGREMAGEKIADRSTDLLDGRAS